MNSDSICWEIRYKVVGSDKIYLMKIDLHFNKERNVERWFNLSHNGRNNKSECEFISAKIINKKPE